MALEHLQSGLFRSKLHDYIHYTLCVEEGANLRVNISDSTACLVGQLVDESSIGHCSRVVHGCANGNACK